MTHPKEQRPCEVLTVIPLIITLPVSCALEDFLLCLQESLPLNTFLSQLTLPYMLSTCCLISTFRCVRSIAKISFIMSVWPHHTDFHEVACLGIVQKKQRPCEMLTVIPLIITLSVSRELEDYYCVHKSPSH